MASGKKYVKAKELVEVEKKYSIQDAVALIKKMSYSKFVGTLNVAVKTFADPKYNDQQIRATAVLPHGTGKKVTIAAYVSDDQIAAAKAAGADIAGNAEIIKDIEAGKINFDVMVTTPDMMRELARIAKVLGPKGLMPSPKAGTVTQDLVATIDEVKKGRIEFRIDKTGNIHAPLGKLSFGDDQLVDNFTALMKAIDDSKPAGVKGKLVKKVVLSATMSPGVQIEY
ncbi:50S ribosomal protein L1 [Patescibacteria group bacterium]|nr:50S ribosomal protein L1 [Patescibacteria group bacterium]